MMDPANNFLKEVKTSVEGYLLSSINTRVLKVSSHPITLSLECDFDKEEMNEDFIFRPSDIKKYFRDISGSDKPSFSA